MELIFQIVMLFFSYKAGKSKSTHNCDYARRNQ